MSLQYLLLVTFLFLSSLVSGQNSNRKLVIERLHGDMYVYTTYNDYKGDKVPANGLYLVTRDGIALFDTPWDTTQFQPLLDSLRAKHGLPVKFCIATHWHNDKTAGLEYYSSKGITTLSTDRTDQLSRQHHEKRAANRMPTDTSISFGGYIFRVFFPGEGHTADNLVAWFPKEKILYGGCLIKGIDAENLGFLGDANKAAYAATLKTVQQQCANPRYIITTHSEGYSNKALQHSIKLAEKLVLHH